MKSEQWLVEMAEYISNHPNFLVNGFIRSDITAALDETEEPVALESGRQESSYCSSDEDCSTCNNSDRDDSDPEDCCIIEDQLRFKIARLNALNNDNNTQNPCNNNILNIMTMISYC